MACTVDACNYYQPTRKLISSALGAYVDDTTQSSYSVCPVDHVAARRCRVLHDTTRDHNYIFGRLRELFDDEVHHLSKGSIFVLKQL